MAALNLRPERVRALRLQAQHLTDASPSADLPAAAVCGLQDTPAGSADLGLAARVPGAMPPDVRAAFDDRQLAVVWSRRGAPCVVAAEDVAVFTLGMLPDDDESWRTVLSGFVSQVETTGLPADELVAIVRDAVDAALADGERSKRELVDAAGAALPPGMRQWFEPPALASFTTALVRAASLYGRFVLVSDTEGEERFARTDAWLGEWAPHDENAARAELARRFLHAYGASMPRGFAEWAGVSESFAKRSFALIGEEIVPVRVEGADGRLLAEDAERVDEVADPEGVRLLPPHDAYLAAPDRRVIVPEPVRHKGLWKAGGNPGAVLVNGEIAGVWRAETRGKRMTLVVHQFRTLPAAMRMKVEIAAARLAAFKGAQVAITEFGQ